MSAQELITQVEHLYQQAKAKVVDPSGDYWENRMKGEKGVTWDEEDRWPWREYAIPDSILLGEKGLIRIGVYMSMRGLKYGYSFLQTEEGLVLHQVGFGFDSGEKYLFRDGEIFSAKINEGRSCPTVNATGSLAWSSPRASLLKEWEPADEEKQQKLRETLKKITI